MPRTQEQLPIFEGGDCPEASILDIVDRTGLPVMAKGRGAPLELRLAVQILVAVPFERRRAVSELELTVREIRDLLFPKRWERRRDWPCVITALSDPEQLPAPGGRLLVLALPLDLRSEELAADLDSPIVIAVELPLGCGDGPPVEARMLAKLGVGSAPRFRSYIAAHSIAWVPGRTRIPASGNPRSRAWIPVRDPHAYRVHSRSRTVADWRSEGPTRCTGRGRRSTPLGKTCRASKSCRGSSWSRRRAELDGWFDLQTRRRLCGSTLT